MATVTWGSTDLNPLLITNAPGPQTGPAVADNGGTEFGVAWTDGATITVKFFDEQGLPSAALPTSVVTDATSLGPISGVHIAAGGVGGYGVVWQEGNSLQLRYIAETGLSGPEISVSPSANVQHDVAIA